MKEFKAGDRVQLTGKFLRSTGQVAGKGEGRKIWTVLAVDAKQGSTMLQVDEIRAELGYWTKEELEADPSLKYRRINAFNVKHYGKPSSKDC